MYLDNGLGEGLEYLSESLKVNTTLTQLYANDKTEFSEYLSRNEKLQSMSLPDELASFMNVGYLSDVTLRIKDGEQIRAHRIVLAAMSRCAFIHLPFFRHDLCKNQVEHEK